MILSNYHTHTLYSDGKNTPKELVLKAIELGCPEIGFSEHSFTEFDKSYCMSIESTEKYIEEINFLKEKYKDKIKILLGLEKDFYSDYPTDKFDFVIGSVHYVKKDGVYIPIDLNRDSLIDAVKKYYNNDFYSLVEDYYNNVSQVYERTKCDIIGHFDLITKFNENDLLFKTDSPQYKKHSDRALNGLLKSPARFEINFGAMARGYRSSPYPEKRLFEMIKKSKREYIYSSDCHDKNFLLFGQEIFCREYI